MGVSTDGVVRMEDGARRAKREVEGEQVWVHVDWGGKSSLSVVSKNNVVSFPDIVVTRCAPTTIDDPKLVERAAHARRTGDDIVSTQQ